MPGFYISNIAGQPILNNANPKMSVSESKAIENYTCSRNTLNKFMDDKLFEDTKNNMIIIDGVILNKKELIKKYGMTSWCETVTKMIDEDSKTFFKNFEGPFSGAAFDKTNKQWVLFTNQTGETPLFYYQNQETREFIVASQVNYILDNIDKSKLHLEKSAVIDMLTFGFMERNETYAKEIKRLPSGAYLSIDKNGTFDVVKYYTLGKNKYDLKGKSETEIIEELDEKFRKAVSLEFEKDREYGYSHLVDLSGGLDSRMTSFVAHSLGYTKQQNITYCQSNSSDELIAKQIASKLHHELLVRPLDDIQFMYDAEKIISMNYGLSLYCGITGGQRLLESLNDEKFGIEHTGMIGDVVIGSFMGHEDQLHNQTASGMYCKLLEHEVKGEYSKSFEDQEIYLFYSRGFHGACATHMIRANYFPSWSPFMNTDFLDYCQSIPVTLRINHYIYKKWIWSKYPEAAKFKWEKTGLYIKASRMHIILHRTLKRGPVKIAKMLHLPIQDKSGMNPTDYWYKSNEELRKYFDKIFDSLITNDILEDDLKAKIKLIYNQQNCMDKVQAITVLLSLEKYFRSNDKKVR